MTQTIEQIMEDTETWVVTGKLNTDMLAENFQFISPFWKSNNRAEFIEVFQNSGAYQKILANIVKFDPLVRCVGLDSIHFSIVLRYFTRNGCSVWETVLGKVENGLLVEARSIYDLAETRKAHELD